MKDTPTTASPPAASAPGSSLLDLPRGSLACYALPIWYFSTVGVAAYLANSSAFTRAVPLFFKALGVPPERVIVALGGISYVVAHPLAGGFSMVGQTLGPGGKYCNKEPRSSLRDLTGLGRRLVSTHQSLIETFPGLALAAVLVQLVAPKSQRLTNLLALYVLLKTTLYPLGYISNIDPIRTFSFLIANGALVNVFWILARGGQ